MLNIPYDPLDVMTVLEVEGQLDEDEPCELYVIEREELTLHVTFFLAEPRAEISLQRQGDTQPLLHFSLWRGQVSRVIDGRGELLEFSNCTVGRNHFSNYELPTRGVSSVLLWIKPQIRVAIT